MAAQQGVMIAFFGAFAGFSAFGTIIATFLISRDGLQRLAARWAARAVAEALKRSSDPGGSAIKWARRCRVIFLWSVGGAVAVASLVSALGLLTSGLWLYAHTRADVGGWTWAYRSTGYLLGIEVALITVIAVLVMATAVWSAVKYGQKTEDALKSAEFAFKSAEDARASGVSSLDD